MIDLDCGLTSFSSYFFTTRSLYVSNGRKIEGGRSLLIGDDLRCCNMVYFAAVTNMEAKIAILDDLVLLILLNVT